VFAIDRISLLPERVGERNYFDSRKAIVGMRLADDVNRW
jgi:hypothetical protein